MFEALSRRILLCSRLKKLCVHVPHSSTLSAKTMSGVKVHEIARNVYDTGFDSCATLAWTKSCALVQWCWLTDPRHETSHCTLQQWFMLWGTREWELVLRCRNDYICDGNRVIVSLKCLQLMHKNRSGYYNRWQNLFGVSVWVSDRVFNMLALRWFPFVFATAFV